MQYASLGSGSAGNATLISHQDTRLLLDCGFSLGETQKRLAKLQVMPEQLDAILVTHEHSDHVRGVGPLARKYRIPVYLTRGTYSQAKLGALAAPTFIDSHQRFAINDIEIEPVPVPHDAREPCQFIFHDGQVSLGVLTDLGSITPFVVQCYRRLDALLLECNHDVGMLDAGPYPYSVRQRIKGDFGHLSNVQAASFLQQIELSALKHVVISHISRQNNTTELAVQALDGVIDCGPEFLTVADQALGFGWRTVD